MSDVKVSFSGNATQLQKTIDGIGKSVSTNLTNQMTNLGGAIAGAFTVAKATQFVSSIVELGGAITDGAARTGLATDEFQQLSYACKQTGTDMSAVEASFKKLNDLSVDDKAAEKLKVLGITLEDFAKASQYEKFGMVSDAISMIEDPAQRGAMAIEYLGKGGKDLVPLLGQFRELGEEIKASGGIMSDEAIAAADGLGDSLDRLGTVSQAFVANTGFIDYLAKIVEAADACTGSLERMGNSKGVTATDSNYFGFGLSGFRTNTSPISRQEVIEANEKRRKKLAQQQEVKKQVDDLKNKKVNEAAEKNADEMDKYESDLDIDQAKKVRAAKEESDKTYKDLINKEADAQADFNIELGESIIKQKLLNSEGKKAAYLFEERNRMEALNMSDADIEKNLVKSSRLYDLENPDPFATQRLPDFSDSLLRIGGTVGNAPNTESMSLERQQVASLQTIAELFRQLQWKWDASNLCEKEKDIR